jgi:hypothetical protein
MPEEMRSDLVRSFTYRGLACEVIQNQWTLPDDLRLLVPEFSRPWCNGYITGPLALADAGAADRTVDAPGGVTYFAKGLTPGAVTIGFDTAHVWDTAITKSPDAVERVCRAIVDQLYAAGVVGPTLPDAADVVSAAEKIIRGTSGGG